MMTKTEREHLAARGLRYCSHCGRELPFSDFYKNGNYYRPYCKKCTSATNVETERKRLDRTGPKRRYTRREVKYRTTAAVRPLPGVDQPKRLTKFYEDAMLDPPGEGLVWGLKRKTKEQLLSEINELEKQVAEEGQERLRKYGRNRVPCREYSCFCTHAENELFARKLALGYIKPIANKKYTRQNGNTND